MIRPSAISVIVLLSGCALLNTRTADPDHMRHPKCNTINLVAVGDALAAAGLLLASAKHSSRTRAGLIGSGYIFGFSSIIGLETSRNCRRAHDKHVKWRETQQRQRALQDMAAKEARTVQTACRSEKSEACEVLVSSYMVQASAAFQAGKHQQAIELLDKIFRAIAHPEILYAKAEIFSQMSQLACDGPDIALCRKSTEMALRSYHRYRLIGGAQTGARLIHIDFQTNDLLRRLAQLPRPSVHT
jgi:hypothetical protein